MEDLAIKLLDKVNMLCFTFKYLNLLKALAVT